EAALRAAGGHADALGGPVEAVADEDVAPVVGVPGDQVGGHRLEGHEPPVGADGRVDAVAVSLRAARGHAYALHGAPEGVADEDVGDPVDVAGDQVRGVRLEGHEPAVGADGGPEAGAVRLRAVAGHAYPLQDLAPGPRGRRYEHRQDPRAHHTAPDE